MNKNTFNALVFSLASTTFLSGCDCAWEETASRKAQCAAEEQTQEQEKVSLRRAQLLQGISAEQKDGVTLFVDRFLEFSPMDEHKAVADYELNQEGKNLKSILERGVSPSNPTLSVSPSVLGQIFKCNENRSPTGNQRWVDPREETETSKTAVEEQLKMCLATQSVELSRL